MAAPWAFHPSADISALGRISYWWGSQKMINQEVLCRHCEVLNDFFHQILPVVCPCGPSNQPILLGFWLLNTIITVKVSGLGSFSHFEAFCLSSFLFYSLASHDYALISFLFQSLVHAVKRP